MAEEEKVKRSFFTTLEHVLSVEHVEHVNCNLCGGGRYRVLGNELGFDIRVCHDCGLFYVDPQPTREELPRLYEAMYAGEAEQEAPTRSLGYVERHLRALLVRRRPEGGRLLEVGCGYGSFLKEIEDLPWQLSAIELSERAVHYARSRLPRAVIQQTGIEEAAFPAESQDCVVLIAVLEHAKDPRRVLERVTRWLAPGGLVVVQVPYPGPWARLKRIVPFLPVSFEAPRHLFGFSPKTLRRYLAEAGYAAVDMEIARPYSSPNAFAAGLIWGVKLPGLALWHLTGRRYIYPFASAIVACARKPE